MIKEHLKNGASVLQGESEIFETVQSGKRKLRGISFVCMKTWCGGIKTQVDSSQWCLVGWQEAMCRKYGKFHFNIKHLGLITGNFDLRLLKRQHPLLKKRKKSGAYSSFLLYILKSQQEEAWCKIKYHEDYKTPNVLHCSLDNISAVSCCSDSRAQLLAKCPQSTSTWIKDKMLYFLCS